MITAQVENWETHFEEVQNFLPLHWAELALNQDKVPLVPQWDIYNARNAAGELMIVTLREDGQLVGYFWGFIAPGLHYKTCLTLTMDIYWVHPDCRNGTSGKKLIKAVEAEAKRRGVQRMYMGSKNHKDSSRLFTALGFEPVETYHSKWIGD